MTHWNPTTMKPTHNLSFLNNKSSLDIQRAFIKTG